MDCNDIFCIKISACTSEKGNVVSRGVGVSIGQEHCLWPKKIGNRRVRIAARTRIYLNILIQMCNCSCTMNTK